MSTVSLALVLSLLAPLQPSAPGAGAAPSEQRLEQDDAPRSAGDELLAAERAVQAGDAREAARACERVLARVAESLARSEGTPDAEVRSELFELVKLGEQLHRLDAPDAASALLERAAALYERHLPADAPDALRCRGLRSLLASDEEAARACFEAEARGRAASGAEDDPDLLGARAFLAVALRELGDLEGARALQEAVLATCEATLPEGHPDLLLVRAELAVTLYRLGDPKGARALEEGVLAAREASLPEGHPFLTAARATLSGTLFRLGDLEGSSALDEAVLAAREARLPEGHPDLLRARANLAMNRKELGDLEGARALEEAVLAAREASLPEGDPKLLLARGNLASTLGALGDLEGARVLQEAVLAACEASLPEDDPYLLVVRGNLASTLGRLGDHEGARALEEEVLAAREATLPEGHPDILIARANLAVSLNRLGDAEGARAMEEAVLAALEASLPEGHPRISSLRGNLAVNLSRLGDLEGARALQEKVLASYEASLPADHPDLLRARANLAITLSRLGDQEGARALEEAVLAAREATLPEGHPDLLRARGHLAGTLILLGDPAAARGHLPGLAAGMLARTADLVAVSPREAMAVARYEASHRLWIALYLSAAPRDGEAARADTSFELVETLRHVSQQTATRGIDAGADDEVTSWRREAARLRAELNDLVAGGGGADAEHMADEVRRLSLARDRVERRLRERLAEDGVFTDSIGAGAVAAALEPGTAAAGFLRYDRIVDPETLRTEPALLAHVVRPGAPPVRLELGPADELEELVLAWRASLAAPVVRGVAIEAADEEDGGEELRARVLDPVLAAAGDVHTLHVCLDDFLFLAPLEALPLDDGCVGDRVHLVSEVSFARLIAPPPPTRAEPVLLALGGASFNAQGASSLARVPGAATPPADPGERSRPAMRFGALLQTRLEVETIGALFEARFDAEPRLLTAKEASKGALYEDVVGARFVHLATHGWFAPESVASQADERGGGGSWEHMDAREAVTGFAPMTLCGLALAGANTGPDSMGRVPGILTAEELAGLDLSQCELAVLSACETNVGVRRAGQGIQSLQAALHAAGARTSVTSLWKVDDAMTRRLMELFYSYLWLEGMGKADALWSAKRDLRDEGAAPRDWSGWVLTGAAD